MSWELTVLIRVVCNEDGRNGVSGRGRNNLFLELSDAQETPPPPVGSLEQEECGFAAPQPSQPWILEAYSGALVTMKWP